MFLTTTSLKSFTTKSVKGKPSLVNETLEVPQGYENVATIAED